MAGAGIFSTTVLLLLLAVAVFTSDASDSVTAAVQATDSAGTEETSNLLPVHHSSGDKEETMHKLAKASWRRDGASGDGAENLASTEEDGKMVGSDGRKAKKMDDEDDDDDDDKDDSNHDHDSDNDSDSDHDHDSDHDSDSDHDHDSDSDDSDHDSESNSDDDDDDDDGDSKHERRSMRPSGEEGESWR